MNQDQIKVGGEYQAKVGQKMTTVRVLRIKDLADVPPKGVNKGIMYYCLNLSTNRECKFRGAMGFSPTVASLFMEQHAAELSGKYDKMSKIERMRKAAFLRSQAGEPSPDLPDPSPIPSGKPSGMGARLAKSHAPVTVPHIRLRALAGCGKTTTLVEGLKEMRGFPTKINPSPQQREVWDSLKLSENPSTVCLVSFGNAIVDELIERIKPIEHTGVEAKTLHKLGNAAIRKSFELLPGRDGINGFRVDNLLATIMGRDLREVKKFQPELVPAVKDLVRLCKVNLKGLDPNGGIMSVDSMYDWESCLDDLTHYYDIDLGGHRTEIFSLVPKVLARCLDVAKDKYVDFDDMPWLPIALNLPIYQYDLLLVDEAQDLNACQHALCMRAGKRILFCGDEHQAIYGFTGADCDSMDSLYDHLSNTAQTCITLMLNVTRRCGKAIVEEAQKFVPEFEAHDSNPEGKVSYAVYRHIDPKQTYHHLVEDGDMCVCRVNAPLVSQCFRFLKEGRKAYIQGRDIGTGLIKLITKLMKDYVPAEEGDRGKLELLYLEERLDEWKELEIQAENRKKNPSEPRLIAIQDKHLCLITFLEGMASVDELRQKILDIFTDDSREGIRLSSVHKSKGLEANRVFILMPKGAEMPHPMARTKWAKKQELNLKYVAITRAIHELVYVTEDK